MTIEFHCPNCSKLLRTADSKAGLTAKCPQCGNPITVPAASGPAEAEPEDSAHDEAAGGGWMPPPPKTSPGPVRPRAAEFCPTCGEPSKPEWKKCGFCGENLDREGNGAGGGDRRPLEVGSVMSRAWTIYGRQMGLCIGAFVIPIVIFFAMYILMYAVLAAAVVAAGAAGGNNMGAVAGIVGVIAVVVIGAIVLQWWLQLGLLQIYVRVARGEQTEIGDLFRGGRYLVRFIGLGLITMVASVLVSFISFLPAIAMGALNANAQPDDRFFLAVGLGYLLYFVLWLGIAVVFWPTPWLLVDRDLGVMECLSNASAASKGDRLKILLIMLLAGAFALGGYMMCCIGLIFTAPLSIMMMAVSYCDVTGQRTARV